jgi:sugar phosphate permease
MSDQKRPLSLLPRVCALLAIAVLINYIDRSNLSIAAPLLKDELALSPSQLGILLFFLDLHPVPNRIRLGS